MAVNVTDISGLVRAYAISRIQQKYPNLDITEDSSFDDVFLKPVIELFIPFVEKFNTAEMMQNLENAEYMTEEELDRIGEGNYFIKRKQGVKATTSLTLSFANVLEGETIIIPAGITFKTDEGLQFQTVTRTTFAYEELLPFYNSSTSNYDLPVSVEATEIGSGYNVGVNTIVASTVLFNTNLANVTNEAEVNNGTDKQTNAEYAKYIGDFYISRQLGTEPGYKAFILENFEETEDAYIAGYKNKFMTRDIIQVYNQITGLYVDKHIGGMVDIYVKGYTYTTETAEIPLLTNFFLLGQSYASIISASVSAINDTDSTKTPVILSKTAYTLNGQQKMAVILNNTGNQSFTPGSDSKIYIAYDYTDANGVTQNQVDSFIVGDTIAELGIPVKEIISLDDSAGVAIADPATHYQLIKTGVVGTTQEVCQIKLINFDDRPNGSVITVKYVVNFTLKSIGAVLDKEEYRLVTADILAREATIAYINIALKIKAKAGYTLDKIKLAKIQSSLVAFFASKGMGESIDESDIATWLSADDDIKDYIEYIALPLDSFYIPANASDPMTTTRSSTSLAIPEISYPVLNKVNISQI
ncbi:MAG: hypothetical protein K0R00_179 [Herbinix sp.]|jgi:hypothetical protein|nr:hypothetical protein [Herbinix sp.]